MPTSRQLLASVAIVGMFCLPAGPLQAGPGGGQANFLESSRRQDFTGEGTYHRQGLLREQEAVIKRVTSARTQSEPPPKRDLWQWIRSLFQPKSKKSTSSELRDQ